MDGLKAELAERVGIRDRMLIRWAIYPGGDPIDLKSPWLPLALALETPYIHRLNEARDQVVRVSKQLELIEPPREPVQPR
ncbi:MAG: hypothetical protein HY303_12065 [Candidatus Wallbacteria bacterium]|nr:hypothetical protein [Candidatus Wallbacteria bacterium]